MKGVLAIFKENDLKKWEKLEKVYNCRHERGIGERSIFLAQEQSRDLNVPGHNRII